MKKKQATIEDVLKSVDSLAHVTDSLARSTAKGFESIEKRLDNHDRSFAVVFKELQRLGDDIQDVKRTLGPLVRVAASHENDINNLKMRVSRLETKLAR